jgi:hypothetical protein
VTRKKEQLRPHVESPTWGDVQRLAEVVMHELGGPVGSAQKLSVASFYTLSLLASLRLDEKKAASFIFGKQYLT